MKSPIIRQLFSFFATAMVALCFSLTLQVRTASAQWFADSTHNTMVCDTIDQQDYPAAVTDGNNGAIVAWEDKRVNGTFLIYAQHLNAYGIPVWKRQGVQICKGTSNQRFPIITTDNNGGAYVVWEDSRFSSQFSTVYYAQHLKADGSLAYPDTGLPVAMAPRGRQNAVITDDGRGNAFVAWGDNRSTNPATQPDLYINKLWPGDIKYNDSTSTVSIGAVRRPFGAPQTQFYDGNAHFKSKAYGTSSALFGLTLVIVGKGKYIINTITNDTTLDLQKYPTNGENYRYYIEGWQGRVVDTSTAKQMNPAICSDGTGGCYVAWQTGAVTPVGIKGQHFDSALNVKWTRGYPDSAGFLIYKGSNSNNLASSVNIARDTATGQLMMAWEVTNSVSADTQDVWGTRMNCATPQDTSMAWGSAVQISGDALLNQVRPQVFSDDSDWTSLGGKKSRGLMVTYRTGQLGGAPSDWDIGLTRLKGDGSTVQPATGSWYKVVSQPLGQLGYKAVKIDTGLLLVAWSDARHNGSPDTCLYAQVVDKWGNRHIPTLKTGSSWGMPISGHTDAGGWTAKQVVLVPRNSGAIAVWTDFRKGTSDPSIYAQLIMKDGSRALPYAKTAVTTQRTHSFDGSDCNAQNTSVTIADTAAAMVGFKSAALVSSTNMTVQIAPVSAQSPVTFTTAVIDSMKDGQAVVSVTDTVGNTSFDTVMYCTIRDIAAPVITKSVFTSKDTAITYTISDNRPWDRLLDSIKVTGINFTLNPKPVRTVIKGLPSFTFTAQQVDTLSQTVVCISAFDGAGNVVTSTCDSLASKETSSNVGVAEQPTYTGAVRVYPNPSTDIFTVSIDGNANAQQCDVLDLLGRSVAHFTVHGSATFDASSLSAGTYILRIGDKTVSIVKQ